MNRRAGLALFLAVVVLAGWWMFFQRSGVPTESTVVFSIHDRAVDDFGYVLQYDTYGTREKTVTALTESKYDLLIMEGCYQDVAWTAEEVATISNGTDETSKKVLLCYMSIGEAEDYRFYWNESWDADHDGVPDEGAPDWLDLENPDWPGNYKVRYWNEDWQQIIFGTNESYLDRIISQGFDGVYLDIVDGFEYYEDRGVDNAAQLMVDFVAGLSTYAKSVRSDFLVVPQNGESLASRIPTYLEHVDGIGREDLFTVSNDPTPLSSRNETLGDLALFLNAGKFVFVVDYPTDTSLVSECYESAQRYGFLCYVGPRNLDGLQLNDGHLPD